MLHVRTTVGSIHKSWPDAHSCTTLAIDLFVHVFVSVCHIHTVRTWTDMHPCKQRHDPIISIPTYERVHAVSHEALPSVITANFRQALSVHIEAENLPKRDVQITDSRQFVDIEHLQHVTLRSPW